MPPAKGSAWERRNAKAKAAGYRNYYDYRVHDYGKLPASQAAVPKGEARARLRGHRSAADLKRAIGKGDLVLVTNHSERQPDGTFRWIEITVVDAAGTERTFRLSGAQVKQRKIDDLIQSIHDAGAAINVRYLADAPPAGDEDEEPDIGGEDEISMETEAEEFDRLFGEAS